MIEFLTTRPAENLPHGWVLVAIAIIILVGGYQFVKYKILGRSD